MFDFDSEEIFLIEVVVLVAVAAYVLILTGG